MFLTKNNSLKWKWILWATVIVTALCAAGILWLDKPLYLLIRHLDGAWTHVIEHVFSFTMWMIVFGVTLIIASVVLSIKQRKFSLSNILDMIKNTSEKQSPRITAFRNLFLVFSSVFISGAIGWVLRVVIGRMRPVFFEALDKTGFYPFTNEWAFNSMPSGHAIASFAGLIMIGLLYPKFKWLTWSLAIVIGLARVAGGAHFPSDVLLGAFIGMLVADVVLALTSKKRMLRTTPPAP